jgi:hypothetical protein
MPTKPHPPQRNPGVAWPEAITISSRPSRLLNQQCWYDRPTIKKPPTVPCTDTLPRSIVPMHTGHELGDAGASHLVLVRTRAGNSASEAERSGSTSCGPPAESLMGCCLERLLGRGGGLPRGTDGKKHLRKAIARSWHTTNSPKAPAPTNTAIR